MRGQAAVKSTASDPFGERAPAGLRARLNVLGGAFTVESADAAALRLAVDAFGGMPRHKLEREPRRFHVRLVVAEDRPQWLRAARPPAANLTAGNGLLCATIDAGNFAVVDPAQSRALVCVSRALLRFPYHARYELIELAMVTLASRAQSLVPLHAACFGARGSGLLLMGASGAGKSTLALHALASGMQVLSEDSAFVAVDSLRVTGVPNFLHVQPSALEFLTDGPLLTEVRRSPVIVRRSGARKYEVDLRKTPGEIAARPLGLAAIVFLSRRRGVKQKALEMLGGKALLSRLRSEQPYAAGLANWRSFERRIATLPAYELRRMEHPDSSIRQLRALLPTARRRN
jgi:hypothetical protein